MRVQQWLGEHRVQIMGYLPPNDLNDPRTNISEREDWEGHVGFFKEIKIDELYEGSSNRTNRETFSGLNLSSLNVNSLIVAKQIKARKYLMKELRENQILCLQDTRIHAGDTNKYKTIHKWARENVLSHPRVFCTFSEQGKAGGAMIILPEKSLKTILTVDAISHNTIYIV